MREMPFLEGLCDFFPKPKTENPFCGRPVCCATCGTYSGTMRVLPDKRRVCQKCYQAQQKKEEE